MFVFKLFYQNLLSMDSQPIGQNSLFTFFGFELQVAIAATAAFSVMTDFDGSHRPKTPTDLFKIFGVEVGGQVAHEEIVVKGKVFDILLPSHTDRHLEDARMVQLVFGPLRIMLVVKGHKAKTPRDFGFGIFHNTDRVERPILDKHVVELLVLDGFLHVAHIECVHGMILTLWQHLKINNNN